MLRTTANFLFSSFTRSFGLFFASFYYFRASVPIAAPTL